MFTTSRCMASISSKLHRPPVFGLEVALHSLMFALRIALAPTFIGFILFGKIGIRHDITPSWARVKNQAR